MQRKNAKQESVLELFEEEGGLTAQAAESVSKKTGVPEADVWAAGTFYGQLRSEGSRTGVCQGLSCKIAGADSLSLSFNQKGDEIESVSCLGLCDQAPAAHLAGDPNHLPTSSTWGVVPNNPQLPMNLAGDDSHAGEALERAREMGPNDLIGELEKSGLQGRGGAGFPACAKWQAVIDQPETERYLVLNADEGEPGTFKDRELMLRRPNLLLEGLAIAAEVIETTAVYLYIRGEYQAAATKLQSVISSNPPFLNGLSLRIVRGHGAYICGEETALLESLEGKRGIPRLKPPYPTESGFRGKPTLIHNVETISCIPNIVLGGGAQFYAKGLTEAGTKLYCASGHVKTPGVYEMPLGVCLDELVEVAGGYDGEPMLFSPGGASSGFFPISERRRPLDYTNLAQAGSMLGSAGVVVLNNTVDIAEAALWQSKFFEDESCGQCAPCRIGTRYLYRQLDQYLSTGDPGALDHVDDVAWEMEQASICGLGMAAAKPLESARNYFPNAFKLRNAQKR